MAGYEPGWNIRNNYYNYRWICTNCKIYQKSPLVQESYKQGDSNFLSFYKPRDSYKPEMNRYCRSCNEKMIRTNCLFKPPPRTDTKGWNEIRLLYEPPNDEIKRFEGFKEVARKKE